MCTWRKVRNFACQKFRLTPGAKEKRRIPPESSPAHRTLYHLCWQPSALALGVSTTVDDLQ